MIKSGEMNYKIIQEIMDYDNNLDKHNIEQLAARMLLDLTRNTGFEVSKGDLGICWKRDCCDWSDRQADDICGLDQNKITLNDKMKCIYRGTSLHREFETIGLEVLG